jgi:hypothetical protein
MPAKRTLWPFRKRPADLADDEKERLAHLFILAPQLQQAYDFREQLTTIFDTARSKAEGIRRIKAWRRTVEASSLRCFEPFLAPPNAQPIVIANEQQRPAPTALTATPAPATWAGTPPAPAPTVPRTIVYRNADRSIFATYTCEVYGDWRDRDPMYVHPECGE